MTHCSPISSCQTKKNCSIDKTKTYHRLLQQHIISHSVLITPVSETDHDAGQMRIACGVDLPIVLFNFALSHSHSSFQRIKKEERKKNI